MLLDFRLGYRNEGDREGDWKLLAESAEDRKLVCTISTNEKNEVGITENLSVPTLLMRRMR